MHGRKGEGEGVKKGDYVQTWTFAGIRYTCTGRTEEQNLTFGRVVKCGPKAFEVVWESGSRSRHRHDDWRRPTPVDRDVVPAARKALRGVR